MLVIFYHHHSFFWDEYSSIKIFRQHSVIFFYGNFPFSFFLIYSYNTISSHHSKSIEIWAWIFPIGGIHKLCSHELISQIATFILLKWLATYLVCESLLFSLYFSVYVDMGLATSNPITLTVVSSGNSFSRSFSIKVTQIDCTSLNKGIFFKRALAQQLFVY